MAETNDSSATTILPWLAIGAIAFAAIFDFSPDSTPVLPTNFSPATVDTDFSLDSDTFIATDSAPVLDFSAVNAADPTFVFPSDPAPVIATDPTPVLAPVIAADSAPILPTDFSPDPTTVLPTDPAPVLATGSDPFGASFIDTVYKHLIAIASGAGATILLGYFLTKRWKVIFIELNLWKLELI
jgi:hypothetical protein